VVNDLTTLNLFNLVTVAASIATEMIGRYHISAWTHTQHWAIAVKLVDSICRDSLQKCLRISKMVNYKPL